MAHEHRRATRLALRLGLEQPEPPAAPAVARSAAELARWTAVARWLSARTERVAPDERPMSERVPYYEELTCIAEHESGGRWDISTGNGYYGGLQMDRGFQQTYAPDLYEAQGDRRQLDPGGADARRRRAVESRGFTPWSTTARMCGRSSCRGTGPGGPRLSAGDRRRPRRGRRQHCAATAFASEVPVPAAVPAAGGAAGPHQAPARGLMASAGPAKRPGVGCHRYLLLRPPGSGGRTGRR